MSHSGYRTHENGWTVCQCLPPAPPDIHCTPPDVHCLTYVPPNAHCLFLTPACRYPLLVSHQYLCSLTGELELSRGVAGSKLLVSGASSGYMIWRCRRQAVGVYRCRKHTVSGGAGHDPFYTVPGSIHFLLSLVATPLQDYILPIQP